jgi:hypothetical protein
MKNFIAAAVISVASIAGANAATLVNHASPLIANLGSAFLPASASFDFTYNDGGLVSFKYLFDNPNDSITSITLMQGESTVFENVVLSLGQTFSFSLSEGSYSLRLGAGSNANLDTFEISAVPLPGAALMFGSALLGAGALRRRKAKEAAAGVA